jgi:hypothetical protein
MECPKHEWIISSPLQKHLGRPLSTMIPLPTFRKLLGSAAEGLSEEEVAAIRDIEYQLADAIIEFWLRKKHSNMPYKPPTQPD